ncbi:UPF0149 family protein [Sinimarinibacterium thermocellulolyticum]|uniref:UPF0149 family protein n=1 Tax=Sinimarinibacterium thermocellulolyticum TaxID=3170016 RepID=A0ABV2A5E6_9GAMM
MSTCVNYEALADALATLGDADAAAEYHGALCGALCVSEPEQIDLLHLIESDRALPASARPLLEQLRAETFAALIDEGMSFQPLLPDDSVALVPRTAALASWCSGFLFGLASRRLDLSRCSQETREIVGDLTELTRAAVGDEVDVNIEEGAYAELVEYVRVGAQLVFMEMHPRPTLDPTESSQLH